MNWHNAFIAGNGPIAREVAIYLEQQYSWDIVVSGGRIYSVMDRDGDYICHRDDYDDDEEMLEQFIDNISNNVFTRLNDAFPRKVKSTVGHMTIMPFPKLQGEHS